MNTHTLQTPVDIRPPYLQEQSGQGKERVCVCSPPQLWMCFSCCTSSRRLKKTSCDLSQRVCRSRLSRWSAEGLCAHRARRSGSLFSVQGAEHVMFSGLLLLLHLAKHETLAVSVIPHLLLYKPKRTIIYLMLVWSLLSQEILKYMTYSIWGNNTANVLYCRILSLCFCSL